MPSAAYVPSTTLRATPELRSGSEGAGLTPNRRQTGSCTVAHLAERGSSGEEGIRLPVTSQHFHIIAVGRLHELGRLAINHSHLHDGPASAP